MEEAMRNKLILTGLLIVIALVVVTIVYAIPSNNDSYRNNGIIIDFEDYESYWVTEDLVNKNAKDALIDACNKESFSLTFSDDGKVQEIAGYQSTDTCKWELWVIEKGSTEWKMLSAPYTNSVFMYAAISWAYRGEGEFPTVAVDSSGSSIYGIKGGNRVVTLTPDITENVCYLDCIEKIVGTDQYSNYPKEIEEKRENGEISTVGEYITPNFEAIINTQPSVVFCDGSQRTHIETCVKLRDSGINAVLLYSGESIKTIFDNVFIIAQIMQRDEKRLELFNELEESMQTIYDILDDSAAKTVDVAFSLTTDNAPWVSGKNTFVDNIGSLVKGRNVFDNFEFWKQITAEELVEKKPSKIIVMNESYHANQQDYQKMLDSMSLEWKSTPAFNNNEIYLIADGANILAGRGSIRYVQMMELTARILNPDAFDDGISMKNYIGDDYENYLKYTKDFSL